VPVIYSWCRPSPAQPFYGLSPAGSITIFYSPTFEVKGTLRPTVSRPLRLGVLPLLEQVTRCYIYLSDNYFLYFSCWTPSLTRERVCNLQCNDASSISSYIATDCLSASSSSCRTPSRVQLRLRSYVCSLQSTLQGEDDGRGKPNDSFVTYNDRVQVAHD
jgi:hypothetical protein